MSSGEAQEVADLVEEANHKRETRRGRQVQVWYVVLMGFLGMALGLGLAFAFIVQSGRDSRKATCAVVIANREVYRETPPSTAAGRNAEQAWEELARSLDCDSKN